MTKDKVPSHKNAFVASTVPRLYYTGSRGTNYIFHLSGVHFPFKGYFIPSAYGNATSSELSVTDTRYVGT